MAFASDSTTAPVVQTGLLPFAFRPAPPVDDPRSAVELLDEIRREIEGQDGLNSSRHDIVTVDPSRSDIPTVRGCANRCDIPTHEPQADAYGYADACHGDTPICPAAGQTSEPIDVRHGGARGPMSTRTDIGSADRCSMSSVRRTARQTQHDVGFDLPGSGDLKAARTLHLRRQLVEAAEHGAALLTALGLPRLVDPDFKCCDIPTIGDALNLVIDHLDAMDAPDEDREPYLSGYYNGASDPTGEGEPSEDDEDDGISEPILGAPERHPYTFTMSNPYYQPANGSYYRAKRYESQVSWAQGSRDDREADPHDGPIDEDELDDDGISKAEGDTADEEPWLASPLGDGDQRHWCQGNSRDHEDVTEGDGQPSPDWYARPIGPLRPDVIGYDHDRDMRALSRRADDVRRRLRPGPARPDPDAVIPIGPGMVWWAGPAL